MEVTSNCQPYQRTTIRLNSSKFNPFGWKPVISGCTNYITSSSKCLKNTLFPVHHQPGAGIYELDIF
jgi:hypothetical protein